VKFRERRNQAAKALIDGALRVIAPEGIDEATFLTASLGAQRFSPCGIASVFGGARLGPEAAGFADDLPGLGIGAYRIAPANPASLDDACQYEEAFGIEEGEKLRRQPQIRITIRSDVTRSDGRNDHRRGSREGAEGAQIDLALDLHLIQRRVIPMRQAEAVDAKRQAIREAEMGKRVADQDVARCAKGRLGDGCVHGDHSATGGRRLSPTLKAVTKPRTRLSLLTGARPETGHLTAT
jgi:hypothetical protein